MKHITIEKMTYITIDPRGLTLLFRRSIRWNESTIRKSSAFPFICPWHESCKELAPDELDNLETTYSHILIHQSTDLLYAHIRHPILLTHDH